MRTQTVFGFANSVKVSVRLSSVDEGQISIRFEEAGHSVMLQLSKQKAGALKDALSRMELV